MRQLVCFIPPNTQMGRQSCWGVRGKHSVQDNGGKGLLSAVLCSEGVSLVLQEDLVLNIARAILGDKSGLPGV